MSKSKGTDQGRHIAALRDRARRINVKDRTRDGRANTKRNAIKEASQ